MNNAAAKPNLEPTSEQMLEDLIATRGGSGAFSAIQTALARALVRTTIAAANGDPQARPSEITALASLLPPVAERPAEKRWDLTALNDRELRALELIGAKCTGMAPPPRRKRSPRTRSCAAYCNLADRLEADHVAAYEAWLDLKAKLTRAGTWNAKAHPEPVASPADLAELRNAVIFMLPDLGLTFERMLGLPVNEAHFARGVSDGVPPELRQPIEPDVSVSGRNVVSIRRPL
jgi:hypothetical protein